MQGVAEERAGRGRTWRQLDGASRMEEHMRGMRTEASLASASSGLCTAASTTCALRAAPPPRAPSARAPSSRAPCV